MRGEEVGARGVQGVADQVARWWPDAHDLYEARPAEREECEAGRLPLPPDDEIEPGAVRRTVRYMLELLVGDER